MNRDDIIRMAREAGMERVIDVHKDGTRTIELPPPDLLERFAGLIVAHTKEQCAELMDEMAARDKMTNYYKVAARAIREMNE